MRGLLLLLALCAPLRAQPAPLHAQPAPDVLFFNGRIWTGNPAQPWAEALAVTGERLVAVGTNAEVAALRGMRSMAFDLQGRFVAPGFVDNHTHFVDGGLDLSQVDLRDAATPEELARRLGAFARSVAPGRWITGGNWDHEQWGGTLPTRHQIDAATGEVPVFVRRLDGHMALVNTAALRRAGITRDTRDPDGGTIVRDADGEPTGVLKDNAMDLVGAVMPEPGEAELDEAVAKAMAHAVARGVTQVHDMGQWPHLAAYRRAHAAGRLRLRIYSAVPLSTWPELAAFVAEHGRGDAWLRWGLLKGFVDGSLGSTTAWFYDPYDDAPATRGFPVTDTLALQRRILQADSAGLHVAVHAIGDRANDWLLAVFADAIRRNGPRDRRFRIEHAQHLTPAAVARFAALGVVPSMQPYHAIDDGRWAEKRIGPRRIQTTYAFRDLLDAGARLTFGSDWFVAPLDPLQGLYAAVTRRTLDGANPDGWVPAQKITVEEALRAYTLGNAWAGFQERDAGTLEPGKLADFVVLSADPFAVAPAALADLQVLRTVVGGRTVFARD